MILFIIFAQNIECGYAIPRKISFARHSLTVSKTEYLINSVGDLGAKSTSRVKRTDYLSSHAYSWKTNPVTKDFLVVYL